MTTSALLKAYAPNHRISTFTARNRKCQSLKRITFPSPHLSTQGGWGRNDGKENKFQDNKVKESFKIFSDLLMPRLTQPHPDHSTFFFFGDEKREWLCFSLYIRAVHFHVCCLPSVLVICNRCDMLNKAQVSYFSECSTISCQSPLSCTQVALWLKYEPEILWLMVFFFSVVEFFVVVFICSAGFQ